MFSPLLSQQMLANFKPSQFLKHNCSFAVQVEPQYQTIFAVCFGPCVTLPRTSCDYCSSMKTSSSTSCFVHFLIDWKKSASERVGGGGGGDSPKFNNTKAITVSIPHAVYRHCLYVNSLSKSLPLPKSNIWRYVCIYVHIQITDTLKTTCKP